MFSKYALQDIFQTLFFFIIPSPPSPTKSDYISLFPPLTPFSHIPILPHSLLQTNPLPPHEVRFTGPEKQIAKINGEIRMRLVEAEYKKVRDVKVGRERMKMKNGIQIILPPLPRFPWLHPVHISPPPLPNLLSPTSFSHQPKKTIVFPFSKIIK